MLVEQTPSPLFYTTFNEQVQHALATPNATGISILVAMGSTIKDIEKIAKSSMKTEGANASLISRNISAAKIWAGQHEKSTRLSAILKEIFSAENSHSIEEHLRLYFSAGGSIEDVNTFLKNYTPPAQIDQLVAFVDTIRSVIALEKEVMQKPLPEEEKGSSGFWIFKRTHQPVKKGGSADELEATLKTWIARPKAAALVAAALKQERFELLELLQTYGISLDASDPATGSTALHIAAWNGDLKQVKWLLEHGANPNLSNNRACGESVALHMACEPNNQCQSATTREECVALLIKHGAKVMLKNANGMTPLHVACRLGNSKIVQQLLAKGADVNARDDKGVTPLHNAFLKGHADVGKLLLAKGADPTIKDKYLETPMEAVLKNGPIRLLSAFFKDNPYMKELHETVGTKELPNYIIENCPHVLEAYKSTTGTRGMALEIPLLFGNPDIARAMASQLTTAEMEEGLEALKAKYPKLSFDLLDDAPFSINRAHILRFSQLEEAPTPPESVNAQQLLKAFPFMKAYTSPAWKTLPTEEQALASKKLVPVSLDTLDPQKTPFLVLALHDRKIVVAVKGSSPADATISLKIDFLLSLFDKINFAEPNLPGYRNPANIKDSGEPNASPQALEPETLNRNLETFVLNIKRRAAFVGTPPGPDLQKDSPEVVEQKLEALEKWYRNLENKVLHALSAMLTEEAETEPSIDPTPNAEFVIEYAIAGGHCGTRYMDDAQYIYEMKRGEFKEIKDRVFDLLRNYKSSLAESMVDLSYSQNAHLFNRILQIIDEDAGITDDEKSTRFYFNDPIVPRLVDRDKVVMIFRRDYNLTEVVDKIDAAVNGRERKFDNEELQFWFTTNIPASFHKGIYEKLHRRVDTMALNQKEMAACNGDKAQETLMLRKKIAKYLEKHDVFINPADLKKPDVDWHGFIDAAKRYAFLEEKVIDYETGKIKRSALIYMLQVMGVVQENA